MSGYLERIKIAKNDAEILEVIGNIIADTISNNSNKTYTVFAQFWEEAGKGPLVTPNGVTICLTKQRAEEEALYLNRENKRNSFKYTSKSYIRPDGNPQPITISESLMKRLKNSNGSILISDFEYNTLKAKKDIL